LNSFLGPNGHLLRHQLLLLSRQLLEGAPRSSEHRTCSLAIVAVVASPRLLEHLCHVPVSRDRIKVIVGIDAPSDDEVGDIVPEPT